MTVIALGNAAMPTWKVEGWMGDSLVYGYVIQSWPGCHPLELGMSSVDEAFVATWAPTVDAMPASLVATQNNNCQRAGRKILLGRPLPRVGRHIACRRQLDRRAPGGQHRPLSPSGGPP